MFTPMPKLQAALILDTVIAKGHRKDKFLSTRNQLRDMCKDLCAPTLTLRKADPSLLEMELGKRVISARPQLLRDCIAQVSHHPVQKCPTVSLIKHSSEPLLG